MSYAESDQVAAISDLIAFEGKPIEIDGKKMKAIVERGATSYGASEFGIDNRDEELTATIINKGEIPRKDAPVFYRGKKLKITGIDAQGEKIISISLTND